MVHEVGRVAYGIVIIPYRLFGPGKVGSARGSEHTVGVDYEGTVFRKEKAGAKR
jgi:hypothetical protein